MAIQFADSGGELYFSAGASVAGIWSVVNGTSVVNNAPAGRATTYALSVSGSGNGLTRTLGSNYPSLIVGMAVYIPASFLNSTPTPLFQLYDSGTVQCSAAFNLLGQAVITKGGNTFGSSGTTTLATSTNQLVNGSGWHYVEAAFTVNGSTGSAQIWVDNVSWVSVSGVNTQATANAYANQVRFFMGQSGSPTVYMKDMYVLDTGTGVNKTRLGDISVIVTFPNAAGVNSAWAANTGTAIAAVQDGINHTGTWPDGDTTYISDSTTNDISDFAHQTLTLTGLIYGVVHQSYMRKDDAGSRQVAQVCLSSGTTETGATISLGNTYNYYSDIVENDPHTSAPWTLSGYNAATFGVKEVS